MIQKILLITLVTLVLLPGCASLPKPRPWTREEKVLLVVSILAAGADLYTTKQMLDRGNYEMNPLIGKHPTDTELMIKLPVIQLSYWVLCHYWPKMRTGLLGCKITINTGLATHNSGLKGPERR